MVTSYQCCPVDGTCKTHTACQVLMHGWGDVLRYGLGVGVLPHTRVLVSKCLVAELPNSPGHRPCLGSQAQLY